MSTNNFLQQELIVSKIHTLRGYKVMIDKDLAELYQVDTKHLKRQVKRNLERFPEEFMFELSQTEFENLRRQNGISSWGGTRYLPFAFTEHGVLMLSSVLNSQSAIEVNIQIIKVFTRLREIIINNKDILLKLEKLDKLLVSHGHYLKKHEDEIDSIFELVNELRTQKEKPQEARMQIGFNIEKGKK